MRLPGEKEQLKEQEEEAKKEEGKLSKDLEIMYKNNEEKTNKIHKNENDIKELLKKI